MGSSIRPGAGLAAGVVIRTLEPKGTALPERIADRYIVEGALGRGGMGVVYRVRDLSTGRVLALKQLVLQGKEDGREMRTALFEREYHTLAQLQHPRVIEVYDYGVDPAGPFYTMELLDDGDLRQRTPLPWAEACAALYDVCSSLALLHSRRLLHRDVSPRNVRFTRDGSAKLIDFGAMAPMGPCTQVVGTPPFTAPEVFHRLTIDARTDLFSVGATLYSALTGRAAYPARDLPMLPEAWKRSPVLPSSIVPGIPDELDALVMSLLALQPDLRPRTAFEVMQRLSAIAGLSRPEPESVTHSYLSTPAMVGRDSALKALRKRIERAQRGRGRGVLIEAPTGLGRTRVLEACALEAKVSGVIVLRSGARSAAPSLLGVAHSLAEQLFEALPEAAQKAATQLGVAPTLFGPPQISEDGIDLRPRLRRFDDPSVPYHELQDALAQFVLEVARRHALLIEVDDVHLVDEPSIGLLATLAHRATDRRLLVLTTRDRDAPYADNPALDLLLSRSRRHALLPLDRASADALLSSVFGDVPYLELLCERIFEAVGGNPREMMAIAQHLVDRGTISYAHGGWTLPSTLEPSDMPSVADAYRERVASLSSAELRVAAAHALSGNAPLSREEHVGLADGLAAGGLDRALTALLSRQVLVSDGHTYALVHRELAAAVSERVAASDAIATHRRLAAYYEGKPRKIFTELHHLMCAGLTDRALDRLAQLLTGVADRDAIYGMTDLSGPELAPLLERALDAAERGGRSAREVGELQRWLVLISVSADDRFYWRAAPRLLERLTIDSGLSDYRALDPASPSIERLQRAFALASERYDATEESERGYRPDEAIRHLVVYVVSSIAVGSRTFDVPLITSLPALLEPFAPISPLIEAIRQNAIATCDATCRCHYEAAHKRWVDLYAELGQLTNVEVQHLDAIRTAIAFAAGMLEARLGITSAARWADLLDHDGLQQVSAMYLRKIVALQQGDADAAERYRRKAELLAVQERNRQMLSTLVVELAAHVLAADLTGVKRLGDRIEPLAERHPGWVPYRHLARAQLQRLRGNASAALEQLQLCLELCTPDSREPMRPILAWPAASGAYVETLVALGRDSDALAFGEQALVQCAQLGLGVASHELSRATCLAQARLGDYDGAVARLEAVIQAQLTLGVSGLYLGASYEARARIALWAEDRAAVEHYGPLVAEAYHHGHGSALGARYERLMQEARRAGVDQLPELAELQSTMVATTGFGARAVVHDRVAQALLTASGPEERARRSLELLCAPRRVRVGHLFLIGADGHLARVASRGDGPMPEGLEAFAADQIAHDLRLNDMETGMLSDSLAQDAASGSTWTRGPDERYHALVLNGDHEGAHVVVGVAVLCLDNARTSLGSLNQLATAIGTQLLRAGDTRPTATVA